MSPRVCIYGVGGIGGYFGGRLAEAGVDVTFIARGATLEAMRSNGLHVESSMGDFHIPHDKVKVTNDLTSVGAVDVVILCVKTWQVKNVAKSLGPLLGADTFVLPLQNGVESYEVVGEEIGKERVLVGYAKIFTYIVGPGRIKQDMGLCNVAFGESMSPRKDRVEMLRELFSKTKGVVVETPEDIIKGMWEKFIGINALSGMCALTRQSSNVWSAIPETASMFKQLVRENTEVAVGKGVSLDVDHFVDKFAGLVLALPKGMSTSMMRDVMEGKPSELEDIVGSMVRLGKEAGVPTPVNEFIYGALLPQEMVARGSIEP